MAVLDGDDGTGHGGPTGFPAKASGEVTPGRGNRLSKAQRPLLGGGGVYPEPLPQVCPGGEEGHGWGETWHVRSPMEGHHLDEERVGWGQLLLKVPQTQ